MKRSIWPPVVRSLVLMAALVGLAAGNTGCKKAPKTSRDAKAVTLPKKFNVPPGSDKSVTAELGGDGFDKVAADSGWQTAVYTAEDLRYIADTNAKKGGMLVFSLPNFPATFREIGKDGNSETAFYISSLVYLPLINNSPLNLEFMPGLATHWKVGADRQTYYFRLNPNARFSDGHPVTTEDVLATYKLGMDSTILDPYENAQCAEYDPPVAISKYIFSIRSKTLDWKNMLYFGLKKIYPAHVITNLTGTEFLKKFQYELPPGTGPYTILPADVQKGKELAMTRQEDWWAASDPQYKGQFNFNKVRITFIEDERLQLNKFKKGEQDFYRVTRALWWKDEFASDEIKRGLMLKRRVYNDNPQGVSGFAFNMRRPPFDDPKVRLAFVHLFNREQLLEKLMFNQYIMMDTYWPNTEYVNPNNPKFRYDPQKAAQLLAEAGYTTRNKDGILVKNGQPLSIDMPIDQALERIVTPVQQDLKKSGIQLNFRVVDPVAAFKMGMERNFSVKWQNWTGTDWPNPYNVYDSKLGMKSNTNNITGLNNARIDELIKLEKMSFDQRQRTMYLREMDSLLMLSNQYALAWYAPYSRLVFWNYLGHPDFYLSKVGDWKDIAQYWWFEPDAYPKVMEGRGDKTTKIEEPENDKAVDVMFWPNFKKQHPEGWISQGRVSAAVPSPAPAGDTSAKPTLK